MGCLLSKQRGCGEHRKWLRNVGQIAVFVPGLRIPKPVEFTPPLGDGSFKSLVEQLSALRTRIIVMAGNQTHVARKPRRTATQHEDSTLADLQQALEDYLPVLLCLVENDNIGNQKESTLQFSWLNQEDNAKETTMSNTWYEVLSVLFLMSTLSLSQANILLLQSYKDGQESKISEERRRACIDILLKAAGYLDFSVKHVLPQFPPDLRKELPIDLAEGVLQSLCLQALGQGVDIQLGIAINSINATLAVKRRLACEMVKYWHQANENIEDLPLANVWGEKHKLFIRWKYAEAKAAAYYYHGLMLDNGKTESCKETAAAAHQAAKELSKESKKAGDAFNMTPPVSQNLPLYGTGKFLSEKILDSNVSSKMQNDKRIALRAPPLPDFAVSLKPDEYQLPPCIVNLQNVDSTNIECERDKSRAEIFHQCCVPLKA